jgi:hypothetical protein
MQGNISIEAHIAPRLFSHSKPKRQFPFVFVYTSAVFSLSIGTSYTINPQCCNQQMLFSMISSNVTLSRASSQMAFRWPESQTPITRFGRT